MSFCEKCGNNVSENTNFCNSCGSNLKNIKDSSLMSNKNTVVDEADSQSYQETKIVEKKESSNQKLDPSSPTYAGFWERFAACLLDGLLHFILSLILCSPFIFAILIASPHLDEDVLSLLFQIIYYCITIPLGFLYFTIFESSSYQGTPGKMVLGIKVVNLNKGPVSFGQASGRYFGKIISYMICYIGFIMAAFTDKKQGLHDMMAGTLIIKNNQS